MGECCYYLKAGFPTEAKAEEAGKELNKFFAEAKKAYNFWQKSRDGNHETFWSSFENKYPLITEYLKDADLWGKDINDLSGHMDFGQEGDVIIEGNTVGWSSGDVWHMSDWNLVCDFIKKKYGATKIIWDTEENGCDCLNNLNLYDWEQIVRDILKQKKLLPLLLHVNDDLTILVDAILRQETQKPIKKKRENKCK